MKSASRYLIILVTAPNLASARRLAKAALKARLVACANIVPKIESHYWWKGRVESAGESLILFKTTRARVSDLEALILAKHPYDTPEILTVPLGQGTPRYLAWLAESLG
jgi:periplasmic divalent cation tolerance protein